MRNEFSTGEFKDGPYTFKKGKGWYTIYPEKQQNSERASHIHLRAQELSFAKIEVFEKRTPQLQFFDKKREKAPLVFTFPSFYNWEKDAEPIQDHQKVFENWVSQWGRDFELGGENANS